MKSMRWVFLLSIVMAVGSLGVVGFLMLAGPDRIDFTDRTLPDLIESGDLMGCLMIPVGLVIVLVTMIPFYRQLFPAEIKNALTAEAKVLKVWDTGTTINDNPLVGLTLEFTPQGGLPIQVDNKTIVSRLNVALIQPGITADIQYDPLNPKRVKVETLHVNAAPAPTAAGPTPAEVATTSDRMEELKDLRLKGLITEAEYETKRQEILKGL